MSKKSKAAAKLEVIYPGYEVEPFDASAPLEKLKTSVYEKKLDELRDELADLQGWVKKSGARIVIIFEGRDAAGKGGMIRTLTERLNPRIFRVTALPPPSDRERSQMYMQRYLAHLPAAGEVIVFDRSWYNRAGVERVMGFCTEADARRFLSLVPPVERVIVETGTILLKYFLDVSEKEQQRRFERRIEEKQRQWKLSPMDLESYTRWWDYSRAYDEMLRLTSTPTAPWWVVPSNDKKRAHINCITHILKSIPYRAVKFDKPELGARQKRPDDYIEDHTARTYVPDIVGNAPDRRAGSD